MTQADSGSTRPAKEFQDFYTVLDVPPNAAIQAIEAAYWKKAFRAAPMELDLLNEAYHVLGNGRKRETYDAERERNDAYPPTGAAAGG